MKKIILSAMALAAVALTGCKQHANATSAVQGYWNANMLNLPD